jgi:hypothetical protein
MTSRKSSSSRKGTYKRRVKRKKDAELGFHFNPNTLADFGLTDAKSKEIFKKIQKADSTTSMIILQEIFYLIEKDFKKDYPNIKLVYNKRGGRNYSDMVHYIDLGDPDIPTIIFNEDLSGGTFILATTRDYLFENPPMDDRPSDAIIIKKGGVIATSELSSRLSEVVREVNETDQELSELRDLLNSVKEEFTEEELSDWLELEYIVDRLSLINELDEEYDKLVDQLDTLKTRFGYFMGELKTEEEVIQTQIRDGVVGREFGAETISTMATDKLKRTIGEFEQTKSELDKLRNELSKLKEYLINKDEADYLELRYLVDTATDYHGNLRNRLVEIEGKLDELKRK